MIDQNHTDRATRLLESLAFLGSSLAERRVRRADALLNRARGFNLFNPRRLKFEQDAVEHLEESRRLADAAAEIRSKVSP